MRDFLKKLIEAKNNRAKELREKIKGSNSADEVRSLGAELDTVLAEARAAQEQLDNLPEEGSEPAPAPANENRSMNPIATYGARSTNPTPAAESDPYDTAEYRNAFMNFVCRNVPIPAELRATTTTTDTTAVIPTTMMNEIVEQMEVYGDIWAKVRKLNVQGGIEIPVASLKPVATWITANTGTSESDAQKLSANEKVVFNYYGLECKLSQTLLVNVTTIDAFQRLFPKMAIEATVKALEISIFNGDGNGQMKGITKDSRIPSANVITLSAEEITSYSAWKKKVFGKMKKAYRKGEFFMAQGTFDGYIDGMVDEQGQPIGRVNYGIDGAETYRFGGKNIVTVEDEIIANYETAGTGDVIAVFTNLGNFAVNSNLTMQSTKWTDHDTNEIKNKTILIADGKMVDPYGTLIIKKG